MQQLTFNSASIRWDDDSLTKKVLDFVASSQGQKPEDIANQAKAIVPFLMAQLNNAELTQQVTEAVTKYLDEPKSIEISAEPDAARSVRGDHGRRHVRRAAGPGQDARRLGQRQRGLIRRTCLTTKKPGSDAGLFL